MTTNEIRAALILLGIPQRYVAAKTGFSSKLVTAVIYRRRRNLAVRHAIAEAIGRPYDEVWPPAADPPLRPRGRPRKARPEPQPTTK